MSIPQIGTKQVVTTAYLNAVAALAANNGQTTDTVTASGDNLAGATTADASVNVITAATGALAGVTFTSAISVLKRYVNRTAYDLLIWPPANVAINSAAVGQPLLFGPGRSVIIFQTSATVATGSLA